MDNTSFGGDWTLEKLERIRKYLVAYSTIMNNYKEKFRFAYIDAFAGTGYQLLKHDEDQNLPLFPEFVEADSRQFLDGSARIALQVEPRFTKYIFIEKDEKRFLSLQRLKQDYSHLSEDIILINADANAYLTDLCLNYNWSRNRAVLFLDPFGMQVNWATIEAIAKTGAIDLWYLFPLGVAVNRLLKRDGAIDEPLRERLNKLFGTDEWYESFYQTRVTIDMFGEQKRTIKVSDFGLVSKYFVERLNSVFPGVANNPLALLNSRNIPLYLLCFASGNKRGSKTAVNIAQHILKG